MTVYLRGFTYPRVFGLFLAHLIGSAATLFWTQYFLRRKWSLSDWKCVELNTLRQVLSYFGAAFIGSLFGSLAGTYAVLQTSNGTHFSVIWFRWYVMEQLIYMLVVPCILSLRNFQFSNCRKVCLPGGIVLLYDTASKEPFPDDSRSVHCVSNCDFSLHNWRETRRINL